MRTKIKPYFLYFLICPCLFITHLTAQNEAIIMGKIDNPQSFNVAIEYLKNPFTLEKATYEGNIDLNNLLGIKVNLTEPRTILLKFQNKKIRLFIAPGDTLKFSFDALKIAETMTFEGSNAVSNQYLWQFFQRFPNHLDEKSVEYYRYSNRALEFKNYIDTSAKAQQAFFDNFNPIQKSSFTAAFKEFFQNDITYWRAFHLFNFVKEYNLKSTESFKKVQNTYFSFVKEINVNNDKALNNVYFLHFLNDYLAFFSENDAKNLPSPAIQEQLSVKQVAQPRVSSVSVWENPYVYESRIAKLSLNEEVNSLYLKTEEPVTYKTDETNSVIDYFLKIKTQKGLIGWVPQSLVTIKDKEIIERKIYPRLCFNTADFSCGFESILKNKVLAFTILRDILMSTAIISMDTMRMRTNSFLNKHEQFKQYCTILRGVATSVLNDRNNLMHRLIIPDDSNVEYFNLNEIFFNKNKSFEIGKKDKTEDKMTLIPTPEGNLSNTPMSPDLVEYKEGKPFIFKGLAINDDVPSFILKDINGVVIRQQDLLGKVVFIDFWATWCSPCQAEMTHSQSLIEKYKTNKNIVFVYISIDSDTDAWRNYIKANQLKGIHANDETNIPANFMIQGLPNFLIVDKKGRVAYNSRLKSKINADSMIEYLLK